jgi:hypothetical protein
VASLNLESNHQDISLPDLALGAEPGHEAIDRRSLMSAGAGQNSRMLPDEAVAPYCDALGDRLGALAKALEREQQAGRLSLAAASATTAFLQEIRATLAVMALKHGRQLLDVEPMPLTVDPTASGMPTIKDFWVLHEDREKAKEQLAQIPTPEQLVEQAREAIYAGRRPIKQQILWLQRAYMERLAATAIVTDFRQLDPVKLGSEKRDRLYSVSWTGIVRSLNLFECTTLHFVERGGWHVTGGVEDLRDLIDGVAGARTTLPEMLGLFNQAAWIVPRSIERVTIGPYHHGFTQNDEPIMRAFAAEASQEPYLLAATIDRAVTVKAAQRSTWDKLFGREPMESGPSVRYRVLVAPLGIKQLLGESDEDGQPATVYGLSRDGDLIL